METTKYLNLCEDYIAFLEKEVNACESITKDKELPIVIINKYEHKKNKYNGVITKIKEIKVQTEKEPLISQEFKKELDDIGEKKRLRNFKYVYDFNFIFHFDNKIPPELCCSIMSMTDTKITDNHKYVIIYPNNVTFDLALNEFSNWLKSLKEDTMLEIFLITFEDKTRVSPGNNFLKELHKNINSILSGRKTKITYVYDYAETGGFYAGRCGFVENPIL